VGLVGRRRELAAIERLLERGGVLAIVGPAGSGKTALAEAALSAARARDIPVSREPGKPGLLVLDGDGDAGADRGEAGAVLVTATAGAERARLRDVRGLHYLRTLLAAPGREISALDLVAGGAGLVTRAAEPVLDAIGRETFRARLAEIDRLLDTAGAGPAAALTRERAALVDELRRATGLAGRPRRPTAEAERARVNATRALHTVLKRLDTAAPLAAAHLRASTTTGSPRRSRRRPTAGGWPPCCRKPGSRSAPAATSRT
jgi:hypothetical protein